MRNRVADRLYRVEPEDALLVTAHHTPTIRPITLGILHIIVSTAVRLPDIDLDVWNRITLHVFHRAGNETGFSIWVVRDGVAIGQRLGLVGMEGPED